MLGVDVNALVAAVPMRPKSDPAAVAWHARCRYQGELFIVDIEQGAFEFHDTQGERPWPTGAFGSREWS